MRRGGCRLLAGLLLGAAGCHHASPTQEPAAVPPLEFALPLASTQAMHSLREDLGHVVLLDVWATWCGPCRQALPVYEALLRKYQARGLRVYALNEDEDPRAVAPFIQETGLTLPVLLDSDSQVSEQLLHVRVVPSSFLLDKRGVIREVHEGFDEGAQPEYEREIEQLLAEPGP